MYVIEHKSIGIFFILLICNSCQIYSRPFSTIYIPEKDVNQDFFINKSHEVCDLNGCYKTKMLFFNHNPLITCPNGKMKVVFKDQEGRFRVASTSMSDARPRLVEDCKIKKTSVFADPNFKPNYMKQTLSSERKRISSNPRINVNMPSVPEETSTIDSILTEDASSIDESFFSESVSMDDLKYLKNGFPHYLYDDKGDVIYNTIIGILLAATGFIATVTKRYIDKLNKRLQTFLQNSDPRAKTSTNNMPPAPNANQYVSSTYIESEVRFLKFLYMYEA